MLAETAQHPRHRSLSKRTKLVMGIALGSVVIVLAVAPFTLMAIPDPHPYKLDSLAGERSGTFVAVGSGYYKLYPYSAPLFSFPSDALVVANTRPTVIIKARQMVGLELYGIRPYTSNTAVALRQTVGDANTLELTPAEPLQPGQYLITAPRDSVDEGIDTFYFQISG
jgi:hypothetical protein